ncbi:MAG: glucodextranase DOMON-like domain-containing protein [Myxococcota bacterium]
MLRRLLPVLSALLVLTPPALAEELAFEDPGGDDFGPGTYEYPTDASYARGSFDLREVEIEEDGDEVVFEVGISARIEDPWDSESWDGHGFSLQMVQIYLDTDGEEGSGHTDALPGLNAGFHAKDAWDKVVIISPQPARRIEQEAKQKAPEMKDDVVVPDKTTARGRTFRVVVDKEALGGAPKASWGVQVVMQSNEGYPGKGDLLSRKVNEYAGQHRFGGGSDWDCDPHVLDILVAPAEGGDAEKEGQKEALAYECGPEGESVKRATLPMIRKGEDE